MQIIDLKFDSGLGDVSINEDNGNLELVLTEKNPVFPSQAQINVPLDPILDKLIAQAPNWWAKVGLQAAKILIDNA